MVIWDWICGGLNVRPSLRDWSLYQYVASALSLDATAKRKWGCWVLTYKVIKCLVNISMLTNNQSNFRSPFAAEQ